MRSWWSKVRSARFVERDEDNRTEKTIEALSTEIGRVQSVTNELQAIVTRISEAEAKKRTPEPT